MLTWYNIKSKERYIFIHIPKNGGKYIRNRINKNKQNKRIIGFWGIKDNIDLAHIPYIKRHKYINVKNKYNYVTYSRDPYDRLISAFFYKNREKSVEDFKKFCNKELINIRFDNKYSYKNIHYYPQHRFICNNKMELININIKRIDNPKKYNLKTYYDDDTIKKVNKVYRNDFELLNYKMYNSII